MSWAEHAIQGLGRGETVQIRPRGGSMKGKIESGALVTVRPAQQADLVAGSVVLARVNGRDYLHLIKAVDGDRYQIGNNRGGINGWVSGGAIYGVASKIEN